jgi:hypothetical protein
MMVPLGVLLVFPCSWAWNELRKYAAFDVRCSAVVAALSFYKIYKYLSAIGFSGRFLDLKQIAFGKMIRSYKKRSLL